MGKIACPQTEQLPPLAGNFAHAETPDRVGIAPGRR
jgi:hypothetical protein